MRRESGESNPCLRQEELEEILLGHQSYRMVKILRDISMTEKHSPDEHTGLLCKTRVIRLKLYCLNLRHQ